MSAGGPAPHLAVPLCIQVSAANSSACQATGHSQPYLQTFFKGTTGAWPGSADLSVNLAAQEAEAGGSKNSRELGTLVKPCTKGGKNLKNYNVTKQNKTDLGCSLVVGYLFTMHKTPSSILTVENKRPHSLTRKHLPYPTLCPRLPLHTFPPHTPHPPQAVEVAEVGFPYILESIPHPKT